MAMIVSGVSLMFLSFGCKTAPSKVTLPDRDGEYAFQAIYITYPSDMKIDDSLSLVADLPRTVNATPEVNPYTDAFLQAAIDDEYVDIDIKPPIYLNVGETKSFSDLRPYPYVSDWDSYGNPKSYENMGVGFSAKVELVEVTNNIASINYSTILTSEPEHFEYEGGHKKGKQQPYFNTKRVSSSIQIALNSLHMKGGMIAVGDDGVGKRLIMAVRVFQNTDTKMERNILITYPINRIQVFYN